MLLHKFIHSVRTQNWFIALLEFLLLVAGIFLAFQLDSWNENRLRSVDAEQYRVQLIEDLKQDIRQFDLRINYFLAVRKHGINALRLWEPGTEIEPESMLVAVYQASQIWPFSEVTQTFDELKSTGSMELLGSVNVTSAVFTYYREFDINHVIWSLPAPYRDQVRGILPFHLQIQIREHCGFSMPGEEVITDTCAIDIGEVEARQVIDDIRANILVRNLLTLKLANDMASIDIYKIQITRAKQLIDLLANIDDG